MRSIATIGFLLLACLGGGCPETPLVPARREAAASAEWWNGAVVYEVFVRSFLDSDGNGSGDIAGLIAKLDYLNDGNPSTDGDLGIDAIWLMPIYPSPSYHGYDVTDYDGVNPDYGTRADMDSLIAECHKRGIKVILDYVPNHTSIQHPWFMESRSGTSRRDWYVWTTANPGWTQPWSSSAAWFQGGAAWYYAVFWSGMPDGSPALSRGGTTRLSTEDANVLSYLRTAAGETVLAAHNLGSGTATHALTAPGTAADALLVDAGATLAPGSGGWALTLPPYGSGIWRLR